MNWKLTRNAARKCGIMNFISIIKLLERQYFEILVKFDAFRAHRRRLLSEARWDEDDRKIELITNFLSESFIVTL